MHKWLPRGFALPISDLPIQDLPFATAIGPQSQRDEHHHLLSLALLALALTFVHFDGFRLCLQAQPNAIELHHSWNITNRLTPCELSQQLNLIDALVDGA